MGKYKDLYNKEVRKNSELIVMLDQARLHIESHESKISEVEERLNNLYGATELANQIFQQISTPVEGLQRMIANAPGWRELYELNEKKKRTEDQLKVAQEREKELLAKIDSMERSNPSLTPNLLASRLDESIRNMDAAIVEYHSNPIRMTGMEKDRILKLVSDRAEDVSRIYWQLWVNGSTNNEKSALETETILTCNNNGGLTNE